MAKYNMSLSNMPLSACSQYTFLSNEYWNCAIHQNTGPENHQAGSCKMGPSSDPMAVVDPRLRVHGIKNLRVADTSIMPQVNFHTECEIMIAYKLHQNFSLNLSISFIIINFSISFIIITFPNINSLSFFFPRSPPVTLVLQQL